MNTKHTSKTLQERLERLEALKTHQEEIKAFLANPRPTTGDAEVEFYCGIWEGSERFDFDFTLAGSFLDQAAEGQHEANQYEIGEILQELGLEE